MNKNHKEETKDKKREKKDDNQYGHVRHTGCPAKKGRCTS